MRQPECSVLILPRKLKMEAATAIADAPTDVLEEEDDANAIDTELLIQTVKDLPIIWNTSFRGYI